MVDRIIGRDPRILIVDEWGAWQELDAVEALGDFGGRVVIGLDLATEPELLPPVLDAPVSDLRPLRGFKQSHPTTAAELRRAERRRRR